MAQEYIVETTRVKARHVLAPVGLGLLTLGIYNIVWHYKVNRELRDLGENVNPWLSLVAITVGILAFFVPFFVSVWNTTQRVKRLQERAGVPGQVSPGLVLFLSFLGFYQLIGQPLMQSGLNQAYQRLGGPAIAGGEVAPATG